MLQLLHRFLKRRRNVSEHRMMGVQLRYKLGYIRNGERVIVSSDWSPNLPLDCGLDKFAAMPLHRVFTYALFGDPASPTPIRRDTGTTTISQSGTTLTASGGFFEAADVGRVFKFDSGPEVFIQTFLSSTQVEVTTSGSVGAGPGTVWYVDDTALNQMFDATNSYGSSGGDNGTSYTSDSIIFKRTFIGAPLTINRTVTEVGFNNTSSNATIFDRDVVSPGVSLVVGDQPLAVAELRFQFSPVTPTAEANVATGYDSSGNIMIESFYSTNIVTSSGGGNMQNGTSLEPSANDGCGAIKATFTQNSVPTSTAGPSTAISQASTCVLGAYADGSFTRTRVATWNYAAANHQIFGYTFGTSGGTMPRTFSLKLNTPFTKTTSQVLTYTLRFTWRRILTN